MTPVDAANELRDQNVLIAPHRLAELLSVVDGELWAPDNVAGLKARLESYMERNAITPRVEQSLDREPGLRVD